MDTKTRPIYMLSTRDPLETQGHIHTESEEMEKYIPCKWKSKESWNSYTHVRYKECYKRQGKTLHNHQGINPKRRHNNYKYICTQLGARQYIRQLLRAI